ncbi:hypothetical protein BGZ76_002835, partial [Entomortierella beljakovae]
MPKRKNNNSAKRNSRQNKQKKPPVQEIKTMGRGLPFGMEIVLMILSYIPLSCINLRRASTALWKLTVQSRVLKTLGYFGLTLETLNLIDLEGGVISGSQAVAMALAIEPYSNGDLDIYFQGQNPPARILIALAKKNY